MPRRLPALLCLLPILWLSCAGKEPPPPPDVYTSRGIIRQLPSDAVGKTDLYIQHEAIADFKDRTGDVIGMESMAMPFAGADHLGPALDTFAVGDKVTFTFEVHWHDGEPLRLTDMQTLPAATVLGFEVPGSDAGSAGHAMDHAEHLEAGHSGDGHSGDGHSDAEPTEGPATSTTDGAAHGASHDPS